MFKWFADRMPVAREMRDDERGFTLIELLVVIIIIGILAAIAIPAFLAQRDRAEVANLESDLRNAGTAWQTCITDSGVFTDCDTAGELDPFGLNPSADVTFDATFTAVGTDDVSIGASHSGGATGTFTSADGQVAVTP